MSTETGEKLWGGRFSEGTDSVLEEFNFSIAYDRKMYAEDIRGSIAYARAIERVGIVSKAEADELVEGLEKVLTEWNNGTFEVQPADEDIHTANERRLKEIVGKVAGKLHTGRSRNDQVATDMRLWLVGRLKTLGSLLAELIQVMTTRAEAEVDVLMPGYTHLQRAQAIRWSHWLMSYAWAFKRDVTRLDHVHDDANRNPLGAGAIAGNPFGIDRDRLTADLGFSSTIENSLDATRDRDFVVQLLQWGQLVGTHLSSMAEDLILYCTKEFGFVTLADAYSTGSSLMPQKKNADSLELIRGKQGRLSGLATGFITTLKGLPTTYNKDLQDDKIAMFESVETVEKMVRIMTGVVATLKVNAEAMRAALTDDMLATDVAYYLVRKGVPFREAHGIAGSVVKLAETRGCSLKDVDIQLLKTIHPSFEADISGIWDMKASTDQYTAVGGTGEVSCRAQITAMRSFLATLEIASAPNGSDDVAIPSQEEIASVSASFKAVGAPMTGVAGQRVAVHPVAKAGTEGNRKNASSLGSGFYCDAPEQHSSTRRIAPPGGKSNIVF